MGGLKLDKFLKIKQLREKGLREKDEKEELTSVEWGNITGGIEAQIDLFKKMGILYQNIINYKAPATDIYSGTIILGEIDNIEDNTKTRTLNELVDKVVEITDISGLKTYGVVLSNTEDKIFFDDDLDYIPSTGDTYKVLNTVVLNNTDGSSITALDISDNSCAVLLPEVSNVYERIGHTVYVEKSINGFIVPVVCRGTNRQRGRKTGLLIRFGELVRLVSHTYLTDHYDILTTENIRRFGGLYFNDNELLTESLTYVPFGLDVNITQDYGCRFLKIVEGGYVGLKYTSLFPVLFKFNFRGTFERDSGTTTTVTIALKLIRNGVETELTNREATCRFRGGDIDSITFETPIELQYGDILIPIMKKTAGDVTVLKGSFYSIEEL